MTDRSGPLAGLNVLEIESIGPGPFAAMTLADLGANVLRISRASAVSRHKSHPVLGRGRTATLGLDLKGAAGAARLLSLVEHADALLEGFRPGVMEELGLGPDRCLARNQRLVYGRVTGWGRTGPLASAAGHDINYIGITGALHACGNEESGPMPPLNLVGDFGGGGLLLAFGIVCALWEAKSSGHGQVVDAAMTDGTATLMAMIYGMRATGRWQADRAGNMLDGSAYFYTCYECADGQWMAVGAIEPEFRLLMLKLLGLENESAYFMRARDDDAEARRRLAGVFESQPRAYWEKVFDGTDACVSPVLHIDEVVEYPQHRERESFKLIDGVIQPMASPRFGRTPARAADIRRSAHDIEAGLEAWGLTASELI